MTNPDNALGTNGAFGGRTSVNAFNDVLATFDGAGVVSGFVVEPDSGMTVAVGGDGTTRDVAVAEDPFGNRTTVDNISGDPIPVTIDTASTTTARIDSIVAYVNSPANASTTDVDNPTACGIISVNGTSGGAPLDAAIRTAITADGGTGSTAYYVVIANVSVPANTTTITSGLISVGKSINLSATATSGSNGLMSGADKSKLDGLRANTYSTSSDPVVGTFNGKPLYRHISQITAPSTAYQFTQIATGLPAADIDIAFIENGWVRHSTENFVAQINSTRGASSTQGMFDVSTVWVRINGGWENFAVSVGASFVSQTINVVVLYTKTTD